MYTQIQDCVLFTVLQQTVYTLCSVYYTKYWIKFRLCKHPWQLTIPTKVTSGTASWGPLAGQNVSCSVLFYLLQERVSGVLQVKAKVHNQPHWIWHTSISKYCFLPLCRMSLLFILHFMSASLCLLSLLWVNYNFLIISCFIIYLFTNFGFSPFLFP
jgi:hypothetical protein